VKYFLLNQEKLEFALSVIKHRDTKRAEKEERAQQEAAFQARYEAGMDAQYGIKSPSSPVSTPPQNGKGKPPMRGENTNDDPTPEVGEGWEPNDGDSTPIKSSLIMLLSAITRGIEAIKVLFKSWTVQRRWCVTQLLEEVAPQQLRKLEQLIPNFYEWLNFG
jgi:hypothetical protein